MAWRRSWGTTWATSRSASAAANSATAPAWGAMARSDGDPAARSAGGRTRRRQRDQPARPGHRGGEAARLALPVAHVRQLHEEPGGQAQMEERGRQRRHRGREVDHPDARGVEQPRVERHHHQPPGLHEHREREAARRARRHRGRAGRRRRGRGILGHATHVIASRARDVDAARSPRARSRARRGSRQRRSSPPRSCCRRPLVNNDGVYYLLAAEAWARGGLEAARAVYLWPFFSGLVAGRGRPARDVGGDGGPSPLRVPPRPHLRRVRGRGRAPGRRPARAVAGGGAGARASVAQRGPRADRARLRRLGAGAPRPRRAPPLRAFAAPRTSRDGRPSGRRPSSSGPTPPRCCWPRPWPSSSAGTRPAAGGSPSPWARWPSPLAVAAAALAWVLTHPVVEVSAGHFRRASAALAASFPLPYGREYAPLLLATGLAVLPVVKTLKALGFLHALLAALGGWRARPASAFHRAALAATLAAAALPLFVQAARLLFVESRYTIFATLVLALLAPFGAAWLLDRAPRRAAVALARPARRHRSSRACPWGQVGRARARRRGVGARPRRGRPAPHQQPAGRVPERGAGGLAAGPSRGRERRRGRRALPAGRPVGGAARRRGTRACATGWSRRRAFTPRATFEGPDGDAVRIYACTASAGCTAGAPGE